MTSIPTSSQLSEVTNSSNGNDILAPFPPDSLPLDQLDINEGIMMSLVNQIMKKNSALISEVAELKKSHAEELKARDEVIINLQFDLENLKMGSAVELGGNKAERLEEELEDLKEEKERVLSEKRAVEEELRESGVKVKEDTNGRLANMKCRKCD